MRLKILNLITLLGVITLNALANILPINGVSTGEVSAEYSNYFTPAGFTFGIWSIIYLSLLVFTVFQFYSKTFDAKRIGYLFFVNGIANMAWIFAWHFGYFILTAILMVVLLVTLVSINLRIGNESWIVKVPFRIYLGWINVATIANMAVLLTYLGSSGWGISEVIWGIFLVLLSAVLGCVLVIRKGWLFVGLTIAWGIFGIYKKQEQMQRALDFQWICILAVGLIIITPVVSGIRRQNMNT